MKKIFYILMLAACTSHAATYYVSTSGNDANAGTSPNQPWKSLSKVNSKMSQFTSDATTDAVNVFFDNSDTWVNEFLTISCAGKAANWITFDGTSWGGGASGTSRATIKRTSSTTKSLVDISYGDGTYSKDAYIVLKGFDLDGAGLVDNSIVFVINANHVKVLNNKIHDTQAGEGKWTPTVHFTTSANVAGTIEIHDLETSNNEVYGAGAHGIAFYPRTGSGLDNVGNIIVRNNIIYNFGNSSTASYSAGIQVISCIGGDISGNVIYEGSGGSDGFGIKLETRNRRCADIDIHGNLIYGKADIELCVGISVDGAQDIDVFNNIIMNTSSEAISWGGAQGGASGRVFNNTIFNSGFDAINLGSTSQIAELRNNIVYQTANVRAVNRSDRITQHSHNNFYNAVSGRAVVGSFTTGNWVSNWEPTGKNGNPGFENINALPTAFDVTGKMAPAGLRITSAGAAYKGGTDLSSVFSYDIEGKTRTIPWDIGACKYLDPASGDPQIPAPPSRPRVILDT